MHVCGARNRTLAFGERRRDDARAAVSGVGWLAVALALLAWSGSALAQPSLRGEVGLITSGAFVHAADTWTPSLGVSYRAHLEASASLGPLEFVAVADPLLQLSDRGPEPATFEVAVPEAYVRFGAGRVEVEAGRLRTSVATARLMVPFETDVLRTDAGQPLGWWSGRMTAYLDRWRVRGQALVRTDDGQIGGLVSLRRDLGAADVELHVRWLDTFAVGLGASGTVADLVVYAEGWALEAPWRGRGAVGASGFVGDALWTAEAGYAPDPLAGTTELPQLRGRVDLPLEDGWSVGVDAGLAYATAEATLTGSDAWLGSARVGLARDEIDHRLELSASATRTDVATILGIGLGVTVYF